MIKTDWIDNVLKSFYLGKRKHREIQELFPIIINSVGIHCQWGMTIEKIMEIISSGTSHYFSSLKNILTILKLFRSF